MRYQKNIIDKLFTGIYNCDKFTIKEAYTAFSINNLTRFNK